MAERVLTVDYADSLIDKVVHFPEINRSFERIRPITDFRRDETEARILYICRPFHPNGQDSGYSSPEDDSRESFILKCKIQTPSKLANGLVTPIDGPHKHTEDELKALTIFTDSQADFAPHLVGTKLYKQGSDGPMPDGYISLTVMTLLPGENLWDLKFWSMTKDEQDEIREAFLAALKRLWELGFRPYDCSLRNVLWQPEAHKLSLVDFEHWRPSPEVSAKMNEREEMMRWGLLHRPPPASHWQEWWHSYESTWTR